MYSSYFMLGNIWHHHFTWSGPNSQETANFLSMVGPRGNKLNWNKLTISCEFGPLQVKWWCHMFSIIKMKEYMESERSEIFWAKMVARNILLGFSGTHFMHMRVKIQFIVVLANFNICMTGRKSKLSRYLKGI